MQEAAAKLHLHLYAPGPGLLWNEIEYELETARHGQQETMLSNLLTTNRTALLNQVPKLVVAFVFLKVFIFVLGT